LHHLSVGERWLQRKCDRRERELGRPLELQEFVEFSESLRLEGLDPSLSVLRVIVYENPYARVPLRRGIFDGRFDECFGPMGDRIGRVSVGEELRALEAWESEK